MVLTQKSVEYALNFEQSRHEVKQKLDCSRFERLSLK